jgi:hypothetical protein
MLESGLTRFIDEPIKARLRQVRQSGDLGASPESGSVRKAVKTHDFAPPTHVEFAFFGVNAFRLESLSPKGKTPTNI